VLKQANHALYGKSDRLNGIQYLVKKGRVGDTLPFL
jgi:hypothetical protein